MKRQIRFTSADATREVDVTSAHGENLRPAVVFRTKGPDWCRWIEYPLWPGQQGVQASAYSSKFFKIPRAKGSRL
jgi:hypothetical protein